MAEEHVVEFEYFPSGYGPIRKGRWAPIRLHLEPFREIWHHPLFAQSGFKYAVNDPHELPQFGNGFVVYVEGDSSREVGILCRIPPNLRFGVYAFHALHVTPDRDTVMVHHEHNANRRWLGIRNDGDREFPWDWPKPRPIRPQRTKQIALRCLVMDRREWEDPPVEPPEAEPEGDDLAALEGIVALG